MNGEGKINHCHASCCSGEEYKSYSFKDDFGHEFQMILDQLGYPSGSYTSKSWIGIYFLFSEGHLIYIGKSRNMLRRIVQHQLKIHFDDFCIFNCPEEILEMAEKIAINSYNPMFNKSHRTKVNFTTGVES